MWNQVEIHFLKLLPNYCFFFLGEIELFEKRNLQWFYSKKNHQRARASYSLYTIPLVSDVEWHVGAAIDVSAQHEASKYTINNVPECTYGRLLGQQGCHA